MKSRATTYLLILIVLGVWGVIVKKLFFRDPAPVAGVPRREAAVVRDSLPDTLRLDYRDPFLGDIRPQAKPAPAPVRVKTAVLPSKPTVPPEKVTMRYLGRIGKGRNLFALIEQGGEHYTLRPGEELDGFHLTAFWPDSIRFAKGEHSYTVKITP